MNRFSESLGSIRGLVTFAALVALGLAGCGPRPVNPNAFLAPVPDRVALANAPLHATPAVPVPPPVSSPVRFRDIAAAAGLRYRWSIPGPRPLTILQTIGNGCAFLDYDNSDNLSVLLVGDRLALYKGDGRGHFTDVTRRVGLDKFKGRFLGCAVGDYDNDGYDDLYLSGYRTGVLLHNEKGKGFKDVSHAMGIAPQPWGTSAAFADVDGDGYLDLYVCNYVQFDAKTPQLCDQHGVKTGCGPIYYHELKGVLYHNLHGQRFEDVTQSWGAESTGNGLGVAFADFDGSGQPGFAVANDELGGDLFQNRGARLTNVNVRSGTASDRTSKPHGGMGVDWGDYDNDGKPDFFVATFQKEIKCLYHNRGDGIFSEDSEAAEIMPAAQPYVCFGVKFLDADNDGWLDLLAANGHVQDNIHRIDSTAAYRQPSLFFYNEGGRKSPEAPVRFGDATAAAGPGLRRPIVGRGLATGDFDNDGRLDALVVDSEGAPLLLHNETRARGHWIGFRLVGSGRSNRDAYGATVMVEAGGRTLTRVCHADGSYLSSSDKRVHVGLGSARQVSRVTVRWPDGRKTVWRNPAPDQYHTWAEPAQGPAGRKSAGPTPNSS